MKKSKLRKGFFAYLLLAVILLSACVRPPSRVGLRALTADLVFGIPPVQEPVAPPDVLPEIPEARLDPGSADRDLSPIPGRTTNTDCPAATVNEVERESNTRVEGTPQAGTYKWKLAGSYLIEALDQRAAFNTFTNRIVKDVTMLNDTDYTFTTQQVERTTEDLVEQTWEVLLSTPEGSDIPPPPLGAGYGIIRDQGTLNGLYLTRIVRNPDSNNPGIFDANPPILYLPLPVIPGFTRSSSSSDPKTFDTITHNMTIVGRDRWDACGKLVQGWFVNGHQTFTDREGNGTTYDYNYGVATQMGGLIIFEHVEAPCETAGTGSCTPAGLIVFDTNIGQVSPS